MTKHTAREVNTGTDARIYDGGDLSDTAKGLARLLSRRDDLAMGEAMEIVDDARQRVLEGEDPEEILYELGLEPDYIFCLL